jgi:hypothetical protein
VYELAKVKMASFQYRATVSLKGYYCYYYFLDGFGSTDDDINIFGARLIYYANQTYVPSFTGISE